jgi:peptidoglycan/LPS O-acetylase OafA/YrhL
LALQWLIALGLTYLISWIVYQIFEKPILNYRDKITSKT